MRTVEQIDLEISELKEKLDNVKGTKCEIYTRIVGYYRPFKNWNRGQQTQYRNRKTYKIKEKV